MSLLLSGMVWSMLALTPLDLGLMKVSVPQVESLGPTQWQRRRVGKARWHAVKAVDISPDWEYRFDPTWNEAYEQWIATQRGIPSCWLALREYPRRGYDTSVRLAELKGRWVMTDLVVSLSDAPTSDSAQMPLLWNGLGFREGVNEGGVTSDLVDLIRWVELRDFSGLGVNPTGHARLDAALGRLTGIRTQRRNRRTPLIKAEIAAAYVSAVAAGARAPNRVLAQKLGLSEASIRALVRDLRSEGYLTAPGRGRKGGNLTQKAKQLLEGG